MESHLSEHPQDADALRELQKLGEALRNVRRYQLDDGFSQRVMQAIDQQRGPVHSDRVSISGPTDQRESGRPPEKPFPWRSSLGILTALAATLLLALFLLPSPRNQESRTVTEPADSESEVMEESLASKEGSLEPAGDLMEQDSLDLDPATATEMKKDLENQTPTPSSAAASSGAAGDQPADPDSFRQHRKPTEETPSPSSRYPGSQDAEAPRQRGRMESPGEQPPRTGQTLDFAAQAPGADSLSLTPLPSGPARIVVVDVPDHADLRAWVDGLAGNPETGLGAGGGGMGVQPPPAVPGGQSLADSRRGNAGFPEKRNLPPPEQDATGDSTSSAVLEKSIEAAGRAEMFFEVVATERQLAEVLQRLQARRVTPDAAETQTLRQQFAALQPVTASRMGGAAGEGLAMGGGGREDDGNPGEVNAGDADPTAPDQALWFRRLDDRLGPGFPPAPPLAMSIPQPAPANVNMPTADGQQNAAVGRQAAGLDAWQPPLLAGQAFGRSRGDDPRAESVGPSRKYFLVIRWVDMPVAPAAATPPPSPADKNR